MDKIITPKPPTVKVGASYFLSFLSDQIRTLRRHELEHWGYARRMLRDELAIKRQTYLGQHLGNAPGECVAFAREQRALAKRARAQRRELETLVELIELVGDRSPAKLRAQLILADFITSATDAEIQEFLAGLEQIEASPIEGNEIGFAVKVNSIRDQGRDRPWRFVAGVTLFFPGFATHDPALDRRRFVAGEVEVQPLIDGAPFVLLNLDDDLGRTFANEFAERAPLEALELIPRAVLRVWYQRTGEDLRGSEWPPR